MRTCPVVDRRHERTKSKMHTPITLGEIMAKRTFTATGEVNPLALPKSSGTSGTTQTLRLSGTELVAADDPQWVPRSMLSILDGIEAAKWAWILVGTGGETAVTDYTDSFTTKARTRPHHLEQIREYWMAAGWRVAMAMRTGKTFTEATIDVMADHAAFQEAMASTTRGTAKTTRGGQPDGSSAAHEEVTEPPATRPKGKGQEGRQGQRRSEGQDQRQAKERPPHRGRLGHRMDRQLEPPVLARGSQRQETGLVTEGRPRQHLAAPGPE